jgi:two-component system response regulator QseB
MQLASSIHLPAMYVLLVEDDLPLAESVAAAMRARGWRADVSARGEPVPASVQQDVYDVLVLDIGLPGIDGLETLRLVRAQVSTLPVLMLTARDAVSDRIGGLDSGADDYLIKPFHLGELAARMRALTRRAAGRSAPLIEHGGVSLDPAKHEVRVAGEPVNCSPREFAILHALMERPGQVWSRAQLEERIYGWDDERDSNAIEVHLHHLRRKLPPEYIVNLRGVGWHLRSTS